MSDLDLGDPDAPLLQWEYTDEQGNKVVHLIDEDTYNALVKANRIKPNSYAKPGPMGNCVGCILPKTSPAPAGGDTRPPAHAEGDAEKSFLEQLHGSINDHIDQWVEDSDYSQFAMITGALGKAVNEVFVPTHYWELIPVGKAAKLAGVGVVAVKGLIKHGDEVEDAAKAALEARRAARAAEEAKRAKDAQKAEEEVAEARKAGNKEDGGYVKPPEMPKKRLKCFNRRKPGHQPLAEYKQQLASAEKGLNGMTVVQYQKARALFNDPLYRKSIEATAAKARKAARREFFTEESLSEAQRLMDADAKMDRAAAQATAEATIKATMKNMDALHALDSGFGGDAGKIAGLGNRSINRSIGAQVPARALELDAHVKDFPPGTRLNVELVHCK